jgi:hypothetical protein
MGLVASKTDEDYNGNTFLAFAVTDQGLDWLQDHQHLLILKRTKARGLVNRCVNEPQAAILSCDA